MLSDVGTFGGPGAWLRFASLVTLVKVSRFDDEDGPTNLVPRDGLSARKPALVPPVTFGLTPVFP